MQAWNGACGTGHDVTGAAAAGWDDKRRHELCHGATLPHYSVCLRFLPRADCASGGRRCSGRVKWPPRDRWDGRRSARTDAWYSPQPPASTRSTSHARLRRRLLTQTACAGWRSFHTAPCPVVPSASGLFPAGPALRQRGATAARSRYRAVDPQRRDSAARAVGNGRRLFAATTSDASPRRRTSTCRASFRSLQIARPGAPSLDRDARAGEASADNPDFTSAACSAARRWPHSPAGPSSPQPQRDIRQRPWKPSPASCRPWLRYGPLTNPARRRARRGDRNGDEDAS